MDNESRTICLFLPANGADNSMATVQSKKHRKNPNLK